MKEQEWIERVNAALLDLYEHNMRILDLIERQDENHKEMIATMGRLVDVLSTRKSRLR